MVSTGLIAIDATILATAVPSIVRDLGGFSQFPWLFSVYLLAQAVSVPIYAKLADIVGRKPLMLFGIGLFLAGLGAVRVRVEHDLADHLPRRPGPRRRRGAADGDHDRRRHLHGGRARQGAGLHRQRLGRLVGRRPDPRRGLLPARASGAGSSSSTCRCACSPAALIVRNFHEKVERQQHRIDYLGAALLTVAMSLLILGVLEGGQAWAWSSPTSIARLRPRVRCCSSRSPWSSGGPPSPCCRSGC